MPGGILVDWNLTGIVFHLVLRQPLRKLDQPRQIEFLVAAQIVADLKTTPWKRVPELVAVQFEKVR